MRAWSAVSLSSSSRAATTRESLSGRLNPPPRCDWCPRSRASRCSASIFAFAAASLSDVAGISAFRSAHAGAVLGACRLRPRQPRKDMRGAVDVQGHRPTARRRRWLTPAIVSLLQLSARTTPRGGSRIERARGRIVISDGIVAVVLVLALRRHPLIAMRSSAFCVAAGRQALRVVSPAAAARPSRASEHSSSASRRWPCRASPPSRCSARPVRSERGR